MLRLTQCACGVRPNYLDARIDSDSETISIFAMPRCCRWVVQVDVEDCYESVIEIWNSTAQKCPDNADAAKEIAIKACKMAVRSIAGEGGWFDKGGAQNPVRYLSSIGLIESHPDNPSLCRVINDE